MRQFIAVTDNQWFDQLRTTARSAHLDEVNFWRPSSASFNALSKGELLLFKLHAPRNVIAGGGFLSRVSRLPIRLAWETFGFNNGVSSETRMLDRIERYRRSAKTGIPTSLDDDITCIILSEPFFFEADDYIPVPPSFSRNIVSGSGRGFDTSVPEGKLLYAQVRHSMNRSHLNNPGPAQFNVLESERFGPPHAVAPRLGQGGFRIGVMEAYRRRCAITGERTLPVLDAAHIRPYSGGGAHELKNGLLLRRDLHTLFDLGYLAIDPVHRHVLVSERIRAKFKNGHEYYALAGRPLAVPDDPDAMPAHEYLEYHKQFVYR